MLGKRKSGSFDLDTIRGIFYRYYLYLRIYASYRVHKRERWFSSVHFTADGRPLIVHYVTHDKFTYGYIAFMQKCLRQYQHVFFSMQGAYNHDLLRLPDVYLVPDWICTFFHDKTKGILKLAEKIVCSGLFDRRLLCLMPDYALRKSYLHFWGGDFYSFRDPVNGNRERMERCLFVDRLFHCAGVVTLIEEDWLPIKHILHLPESMCHFAAPMCHDPDQRIADLKYRKEDDVFRITVGNSATEENQHIEAFEMLRHIKDEPVEIYCPLSYGDPAYAAEVMNHGKAIFGDKFHALTRFTPLDEYMQYLANCDVGIFHNNRQQAGGNILYLLYLGKKVYINTESPLYSFYQGIGGRVFDISILKEQTFEEIMTFDAEFAGENRIACINYYDNHEEAQGKWLAVLES